MPDHSLSIMKFRAALQGLIRERRKLTARLHSVSSEINVQCLILESFCSVQGVSLTEEEQLELEAGRLHG